MMIVVRFGSKALERFLNGLLALVVEGRGRLVQD